MGEAMISSLLARWVCSPPDVVVSDIDAGRRQHIEQKYRVKTTASNRAAVEGSEVVILAVKPQNLNTVMAELGGYLKPAQLVVSIIAGARLETLRSGLGHEAIVRVMPNTPAQIGEGMSVWTATPAVTGEQKKSAGAILGALGKEVFVDDEKYIDMATAVSGSGPAYVFYFMQALVEAGVHIGLPRDTVQELVLQTVIGSSRYARESGRSLAELRRMVTSPGGTTAEALARLEEGKFAELVLKAVVAAHEKARKLGK